MTLQEFVALSLDAEPAVSKSVSWPPAPPPTLAEYQALVDAIEHGAPAPADLGPSSVSWAYSWRSEEGDARMQQLQAAIGAGELPPGSAGPAGQAMRWSLRTLAQWAARAGWDVPDDLADLGVFTLLELSSVLAVPGPNAGNPWGEASRDDTARLIDAAVDARLLPALHPTHLLPVDPADWHEPSRCQLVTRWADVQAWRRGRAGVRLPPQQRNDGPEAAPPAEPRGAGVSHAAADAPTPTIPVRGEREGIGAYRARLIDWEVKRAALNGESTAPRDVEERLQRLRPSLFPERGQVFKHAWNAYRGALKG